MTPSASTRDKGDLPDNAQQHRFRQYQRYWRGDLLLACLFIVASLALSFGSRDLTISRHYYVPGGENGGWPMGTHFPWSWAYELPPIIAVGILVAGIIGLGISIWKKKGAACTARWIYLLLALLLGTGLVVNSIFKMHWGRPRPCQVVEFGGWREYRQVLAPGMIGRGNSFPCGHSSVGYYLSVFYFLLRRRHPRSSVGALIGAGLLGTFMGAARVVGGGHFVSDVAWSGTLVFIVNVTLYYFVVNVPAWEDGISRPLVRRGRPSRQAVVALLLVGAVFLEIGLATPSYRDIRYRTDYLSNCQDGGVLSVTSQRTAISLVFVNGPWITIEGEGHGWGFPRSRYVSEMHSRETNGTHVVDFTSSRHGWMFAARATARIAIPTGSVHRVVLNLTDCDSLEYDAERVPSGLDLTVRQTNSDGTAQM